MPQTAIHRRDRSSISIATRKPFGTGRIKTLTINIRQHRYLQLALASCNHLHPAALALEPRESSTASTPGAVVAFVQVGLAWVSSLGAGAGIQCQARCVCNTSGYPADPFRPGPGPRSALAYSIRRGYRRDRLVALLRGVRGYRSRRAGRGRRRAGGCGPGSGGLAAGCGARIGSGACAAAGAPGPRPRCVVLVHISGAGPGPRRRPGAGHARASTYACTPACAPARAGRRPNHNAHAHAQLILSPGPRPPTRARVYASVRHSTGTGTRARPRPRPRYPPGTRGENHHACACASPPGPRRVPHAQQTPAWRARHGACAGNFRSCGWPYGIPSYVYCPDKG